MLIKNARLVPVGGYAVPDEPVDVRLTRRDVMAVGPYLPPWNDEDIIDAEGRWMIPGLWDQHVHMLQWALTKVRIDTAGTTSADEVTRIIRDHIDSLTEADPQRIVVGFGHRTGGWPRQPTTAELDAVSGDVPVILISGDAHNGWLNSAAMRRLALPHFEGPLEENDWFPVFAEMSSFPQLQRQHEEAYALAIEDAGSKGIVGIVDLEFERGYAEWARRYYNGTRTLRVRTAIYADNLDGVIAAGLTTGKDLVGTDGMIQMGPLKIISDGSLNTRTAHCCDPYAGTDVLADPYGRPNQTPDELRHLLQRAAAADLNVALHAIGDAAVASALDAFAASGAHGTIEHAQLVRWEDIPRMASLGVGASVQPAHLIDDRDVTLRLWPDREDRCFLFGSMLRAGVPLYLGSDAPIAPLDPWLAMAAAVHRTGDERSAWNPTEQITAAQALSASTDRQTTIQVGSRSDVVLLDHDPLAMTGSEPQAVAQHLRDVEVAATVVAGAVVWQDM